jgi:hypothetical protein
MRKYNTDGYVKPHTDPRRIDDESLQKFAKFEEAVKLHNNKWLDKSKCNDLDLDIFYINQKKIKNTIFLLETCKDCPVIKECLETVMHYEKGGYRFGLFAGLFSQQRIQLQKLVDKGLDLMTEHNKLFLENIKKYVHKSDNQ